MCSFIPGVISSLGKGAIVATAEIKGAWPIEGQDSTTCHIYNTLLPNWMYVLETLSRLFQNPELTGKPQMSHAALMQFSTCVISSVSSSMSIANSGLTSIAFIYGLSIPFFSKETDI